MRNNVLTWSIVAAAVGFCLLSSCRKDEEIVPSTPTGVTPGGDAGPVKGFFLLNEGNMGSNKASLDYFDYELGKYLKNIYAERNPNVARELGDVGNDIQIYGDKLYAVINCSNLVEVMNVGTATQIGMVSVPNCRYITFHDRYAYVSSYAWPVQIEPNARLGYVAKIDTATLEVVGECTVGYQPEEMVVVSGKLYVANSGGYRKPNYDRTVSVIDLATFSVVKTIDVAINLHRMELDTYSKIWVSSRGDNEGVGSKVFVIDPTTDRVTDEFKLLPCSNMTVCGDSLYLYSTEWNNNTQKNTVSYAIVNTKTKKIETRMFIKDGTDKKIVLPYGIAVNPYTREIFVTDAKDYLTPGRLYCFGPDGVKKWDVMTGDIPAHLVFTHKKLQDKN